MGAPVPTDWVALVFRALPGALGAAVSLRWIPGDTIWQKLGNFGSGTAMSWFAPPFLGGFLPPSLTATEGAHGFVAFAVGMFGVSVANLAMQTLRGLKLDDIVSGWLRRKD